VLAELRALGHARIAHLGGPADLLHSRLRREAYVEDVARHGDAPLTAQGDYSERSGALALETLLAGSGGTAPPTALVCDNDAMAIGALEAAPALGARVPEQLSIIGWEDSMSCQLHDP